MKQHPFRLRLPHRLVSSVQFRFAVTFTILVAILLALMNTYPTRASRDVDVNDVELAGAGTDNTWGVSDNTSDNTRSTGSGA